ncbi:MAG TPA: hypothetical protein VFI23_16770 [Rhizomicrobium sp.]|nr:hypothetical protein [Rhizomicrobium sp.]
MISSLCLSMISGQTLRVCPEGKPVPTFPDHAQGETAFSWCFPCSDAIPLTAPGPPPVGVTIVPALVACLLLVPAMVFDWRSRGRLHPVYVFGGAALIAVKVLNLPISASSWWHAFAGGILALAQ